MPIALNSNPLNPDTTPSNNNTHTTNSSSTPTPDNKQLSALAPATEHSDIQPAVAALTSVSKVAAQNNSGNAKWHCLIACVKLILWKTLLFTFHFLRTTLVPAITVALKVATYLAYFVIFVAWATYFTTIAIGHRLGDYMKTRSHQRKVNHKDTQSQTENDTSDLKQMLEQTTMTNPQLSFEEKMTGEEKNFKRRLTEIEGGNEVLRQRLAELHEKHDQLQQTLADMKAKNIKPEESSVAVKEKNISDARRLVYAQAEIARLKMNLAECEEEIADLKLRLANSDIYTARLLKRCRDLQWKYTDVRRESGELQEELSETADVGGSSNQVSNSAAEAINHLTVPNARARNKQKKRPVTTGKDKPLPRLPLKCSLTDTVAAATAKITTRRRASVPSNEGVLAGESLAAVNVESSEPRFDFNKVFRGLKKKLRRRNKPSFEYDPDAEIATIHMVEGSSFGEVVYDQPGKRLPIGTRLVQVDGKWRRDEESDECVIADNDTGHIDPATSDGQHTTPARDENERPERPVIHVHFPQDIHNEAYGQEHNNQDFASAPVDNHLAEQPAAHSRLHDECYDAENDPTSHPSLDRVPDKMCGNRYGLDNYGQSSTSAPANNYGTVTGQMRAVMETAIMTATDLRSKTAPVKVHADTIEVSPPVEVYDDPFQRYLDGLRKGATDHQDTPQESGMQSYPDLTYNVSLDSGQHRAVLYGIMLEENQTNGAFGGQHAGTARPTAEEHEREQHEENRRHAAILAEEREREQHEEDLRINAMGYDPMLVNAGTEHATASAGTLAPNHINNNREADDRMRRERLKWGQLHHGDIMTASQHAGRAEFHVGHANPTNTGNARAKFKALQRRMKRRNPQREMTYTSTY